MKKSVLCATLALLMMFFVAGCSLGGSYSQVDEVSDAPYEEQLVTEEDDGFSYAPEKKANGKKYSIGFIDLDPYPYTGKLLYDIVEGLKADGWIEYDTLPFDRTDVEGKELISYLASEDLGEYIEFRDDANYYTLIDDIDGIKASLHEHAAKKDIDVMLACSTSTAKMMLDYTDSMAVIAYPLSDPVGSGIVKETEYSGSRNVWAHTDPDRYKRQMQVFHEVFPFEKIGLIYYDETLAAVDDYRFSASELGVELVTEKIYSLTSDMSASQVDIYYKKFLSLCNGMINEEKIDAFLLSVDMIKNEVYQRQLVDLFTDAGIPIFVQAGDTFVEAGCFMTVEIIDSVDVGRFVARAIEKTLNGGEPSQIPQHYVSTPYLVLNLDAAEAINIEIPFEMLISSEKIYRTEK